ncbi:MAG: bifunctional diaminohydroxyphosphoribosylaminopyrimidine deaminase/5-amino-6-(5-phosphoribosylamino)uracil reductase RibD [Desulfobacterales bacterium]|nr:bifunctional diaminohydroxyphosphoribosylaminopyrimidine deaminase/5-amino-6-(5-phosphoribosylamino)uracil reductase RibD [Desulfobacterales bacterium]
MNDYDFMQHALALAKQGCGWTSPNPMVGAVVVKNGQVVGEGWHIYAQKTHAEVMAIATSGQHSQNATLYVTLEPCNHIGRTPPCTQAILNAGIKRVVVAMADPNPHVTGGGIAFLRYHGIDVVVGICEDQAMRLNECFVKYITTNRPFVILKCAATLDGRIATRSGDSKWVTGEPARRIVHETRHAVDAIMVGINTVKQDNPKLTTRLDSEGKDPLRIVLDTHLSIDRSCCMLHQDSNAKTLIFTCEDISESKIKEIECEHVQIIPVHVASDGLLDLNHVMDRLGKMRINSLLVEGGSRVITSCLKTGIVDKIMFFYAPKILGGDGIAMCSGNGVLTMNECQEVYDMQVQQVGVDILVEGYLRQKRCECLQGL